MLRIAGVLKGDARSLREPPPQPSKPAAQSVQSKPAPESGCKRRHDPALVVE
jgi:hypothetical protein